MRHRLLILQLVALLSTLSFGAAAQRYDRGYDFSSSGAFLKKGTWMVGGTASYSLHQNDNYEFLVADNINSIGYRLNVSPAFSYMVKDNMGMGMRVDYSRNMFRLDTAAVNLAGTAIPFKNYHVLKQTVTVKAIVRNYIPIGDSKRFAMFGETQLSFEFGKGKVLNGNLPYPKGSYNIDNSFGINICPGLIAFADDHFAVEVSANMLGLRLTNTRQLQNQVYQGSRSSTYFNFRVNVLSVGVGLYYYF